jgi:hypothetical protein
MTTNYDFINTSKLPRQGSSNGNLETILRGRLESGQDVSIDEITRMLSAMTSKADLDMDMIAAEEAFDNMDAYYKVWRLFISQKNPPNITQLIPFRLP